MYLWEFAFVWHNSPTVENLRPMRHMANVLHAREHGASSCAPCPGSAHTFFINTANIGKDYIIRKKV